MIELLGGTAAILAVLLVLAAFYAVTYRMERDESRADLKAECGLNRHYENRITNMRADIQTLETALDTMRQGHDALAAEKEDLLRKIGRMEAEARSLKPKRGPNGKFVPKPKAPKPTKPVACG